MPSLRWQGIIGHAAIVGLLDQWLDQPASGYLLHGVPHVGKHAIALRCIRILLHEDVHDVHLVHPDLLVLEAEEGKSMISVERVRELRRRVAERPLVAPRRVVYVPRADRLNEEGMNALLKVLEEPPAETTFVFVCESVAKIPATIQSRVVKIPFGRVALADLAQGLVERGYAPAEAKEAAEVARGCPGLALAPSARLAVVRSLADRFLGAATLGERLSVLETVTKDCESHEDVLDAWNEVLDAWSEAARATLASDPARIMLLSLGIMAARRFVGGALSPRLPLEAAAVKMEGATRQISRFLPKMVSSSLPELFM